MKLTAVRISDFRSIRDTDWFDIGHVTCLVGKNEAGKTAVLQALYRLNPIVEKDACFDVTDDYPRTDVEDYLQGIENCTKEPATVVQAKLELDDEEVEQVCAEFGPDSLSKREIILSRGYPAEPQKKSPLIFDLPVEEAKAFTHLLERFAIPGDLAEALRSECATVSELQMALQNRAAASTQAAQAARKSAQQIEDADEKAEALAKAEALDESPKTKGLRDFLAPIVKAGGLREHIWEQLSERVPRFLYFDEYYQLRGHDNVQQLKERKTKNTLNPSDHPLLGLIELARLDLDKLLAPQRTQELKNKLQGASNHLSKQILKYWSQNKHLRMEFDVRPALPGDPVDMRTGVNIWGEVFDSKHLVSTGLASRSRGFVWFFSFLAWYSSVKKRGERIVLLLDEPGLSLHGRAQADLLRYFDAEIASNEDHQLIYTTHSPFMVDPEHFDRVRIVQDLSIDADEELPPDQTGARVFTEVLDASDDSLFPLQGALGYEVHQTLFVGPSCLVVEGVSDLIYLQVASGQLSENGREGLDMRWTIVPAGGLDKVSTFAALVGAQKGLRVATLVDQQKKDRQTVENLYKRKLLKKSHVLTYANFVAAGEADVEDMFDRAFYLDLVNAAYAQNLQFPITEAALPPGSPRIVARLEKYFETNPLKGNRSFSHYAPARALANLGSAIPEATLERFEKAFAQLNRLLTKKR